MPFTWTPWFLLQWFFLVNTCIVLYVLYEWDKDPDATLYDWRTYLQYALVVELLLHAVWIAFWLNVAKDWYQLSVQRYGQR